MSKTEANAANLLMCYAMMLAASYTLVRTVGDGLFLSRIGGDSLAAVFVASGITTAIIASVWFLLMRRLSLVLAIRVSGITLSLLTIAAWAALPFLHHSWTLLAAIYLLAEIKGCVNTINFVSATNELLGGHSSRSAWTRIGLGAPMAGLVIGSLISLEASFLDVRDWLLVSAVFDLVALLPLANASKLRVPKRLPGPETPNSGTDIVARATGSLSRYVCSRQFRLWIGVLISAKVVVLTFVAFYWKVSVSEFFNGDEQTTTRYFGEFYACVGLLTLAMQGLLTGRLISRRSLLVPILAMPLALTFLAAVAGLGSGPMFFLVITTLARSAEVWRRSVHDTALSFLYTNIARESRRKAIAFTNAAIKPLSEVCVSMALLFGSVVMHKGIFALALAIWIVATIALLRLVTRTRLRAPETAGGVDSPDRKRRIKGQTTCSGPV